MGNTMLILIMVFVAVYLAKAVFTGTGKLLEAENIKKGKEQEYKQIQHRIELLQQAELCFVTGLVFEHIIKGCNSQ